MAENEIIGKLKEFCPTCNSIVEAGILYSYNQEENYNYPDDYLDGNKTVVILSKCMNCNNPFLSSNYFSFVEGDIITNDSSSTLYPVKQNIDLSQVPETVKKPYNEALKCFRIEAFDACATMCRKAIEAICYEKGEKKGNLETKLNRLKVSGKLELTFFNWANELRFLGNDGAHNHEIIINKQEAKDAIDFLESLIVYLFSLVNKYEVFKERRNSKQL